MNQTKQRGSMLSIKLVLFLYHTFGYRFIYYFMYPVTFFYFLIANNVKEALREYYSHLNIPFTAHLYFEHLRMFAVCMVDRFISKIHPEKYAFEYKNTIMPIEKMSSGVILLHSHFGGWASSSMGTHVKNKINIVMQEAMFSEIKEIENNLEVQSHIHLIDVNKGNIFVSIEVANALMNEEIVAMMADRIASPSAEARVSFLGEDAVFNKNPFQVAYKTNKPIVIYFIIWVGIQRYKVEYIEIDMNQDIAESEAILDGLKSYITKYEEMIRLYPTQWFNLYNFWEKK